VEDGAAEGGGGRVYTTGALVSGAELMVTRGDDVGRGVFWGAPVAKGKYGRGVPDRMLHLHSSGGHVPPIDRHLLLHHWSSAVLL